MDAGRVDRQLFSDDEIAALLRAAAALVPADGLRALDVLGPRASAGLRFSEALRLARAEAGRRGGVLRVSETKFCKARLAPLHPTTTDLT